MLTPLQKAALEKLFPLGTVFTNPASLIVYEQDAGSFYGMPEAVVLPGSVDEIHRLVEWAKQNGVSLTARGAGTGLTGGAVTPQGGILVGFSRLKAVLRVDYDSRLAIVQPGVINQEFQKQLLPDNLIFPPDPASYAVSTIGGNIAENAGGPHCLKYGVTANYVQSLEVILSDGRCLELGGLAYDLPEINFASLVTGSEGTLALISKAVLRLRRPAAGVKTLTASFADVAMAGKAVSTVISAGLTPATIELMDHNMINIVEDYLALGLLRQAAALLIFDIEGYPESLDEQLNSVVEVLQRFEPLDLKIARTAEERERLWLGRRNASGAVARISPSEYVLDVSVPRSRLAEALERMNQIAQAHELPIAYLAHAGDGNLHPGLLCDLSREEDRRRVHQAADEILRYCAEIGGSIGGEHGVGIEKRAYMPAMYSGAELSAMLEVKQVFDPHQLLNPGKIFPAELPEVCPPVKSATAPKESFEPQTATELAEGLGALQAEQIPVRVKGAGQQWRGVTQDGILVTTHQLSGISKISADDFYVTARAGTLLQDLNAELGANGFRLAAASPWMAGTLGGLVSTNLNSPNRLLYGGLREQLLAVQVALADGRLLRFGRPIVKDVAGYQMNKLFCGAFGALGVLTEVTLKIFPVTMESKTLLIHAWDYSQAIQAAFAVLRIAVTAAGVVLVPGRVSPGKLAGYSLFVTVEGHPGDVRAEMKVLRRVLTHFSEHEVEEIDKPTVVTVWQERLMDHPVILRAGLPPSELPGFASDIDLSRLDHEWVLDVAAGLFWFGINSCDPAPVDDLLRQLRSAAEVRQGYAMLASAPRKWYRQISAWGTPRPSLDLMRSIKLSWDVGDILNRDEFI